MPTHHKKNTARQRAFTLIELVVAMTLMTLVMGSVVSVVVLSSKTLDVATAQTTAVDVSDALSRISTDVRQAKSFLVRKSTEISFVVPDRTGDGLADTVGYRWSGTTSDPLMFQLNANAPTVVVEEVQALSFDYFFATDYAWAGSFTAPVGAGGGG